MQNIEGKKVGRDAARSSQESNPKNHQPSYAAALLNRKRGAENQNFSSLINPDTPSTGKISAQGDEKISIFTTQEIEKLEEPLKFALIGKFSFGRPSIQVIRSYFSTLSIGEHSIKFLNQRHFLIELNPHDDYSRIRPLHSVMIQGYQMRLFKWDRNFDFRHESAVTPVWIRLQQLPLHLFDSHELFTICQLFGHPIKVDEPTRLKSRIGFARICIELDVQGDLQKTVKIMQGKDLIEVEVIYENLPSFCDHCRHLGHSVDNCYIKHPGLQPKRQKGEEVVKERETMNKGHGKNENNVHKWVQKRKKNTKQSLDLDKENVHDDETAIVDTPKQGKEIIQDHPIGNNSSLPNREPSLSVHFE